MNVELLNTVRERILANAARFNMHYYGERIYETMIGLLEVPPCHTQACIAGETLLATGRVQINPEHGGLDFSQFASPSLDAAEALDITASESHRLFRFKSWHALDGWPEQFEDEYNEAKTPAARAEVASRRILHFIATEGRE